MTPELVRTVLTCIPMVVLVVWIPLVLGRLWRRAIWHDVGVELARLSDELGAPLAVVPFGWAVHHAAGSVSWRGTPLGTFTWVQTDAGTRRLEGLVTETDVLGH